jgi:integrase
VTESSRKECIAAAQLIKSEYMAGKRTPSIKGRISLFDAMGEYIQKRENSLSPSTIVGYKDIQRNRFKAYSGQMLDRIDWQEAVDLEAGLCSPKTVKNAFGFVRSVYKYHDVPMQEVRLPALVKSERSWLTPDEIRVFVDAVSGEQCEIPALLALHSLRRSEVIGLEWSGVDLHNGLIHVSGAKVIDQNGIWQKRKQNKTLSSNRTVKIFIPQLLTAMELVDNKDGFVVKKHPETVYRQIQKICRENGLPEIGWHGLRHSFASLCYSLGVNELTCMQLGGWSDYQTMRKIYTHLSEKDRASAVSKLDDFFSI